MPNLQGGKKYKSSKHRDQKVEMHEVIEADGQMLARVLRALGNLRMLLYCNDGKERICKIRNAIKKSTRILVGDIVLISLREGTEEKGDILAKYDPSLMSKLKKLPGVNMNLFLDEAKASEEGGFEFDAGEEAEAKEQESESESESELDVDAI